MYILAVDTNTAAGSVAILENKRLLAEINLDSPVTHSERLLPSIDFMLETLNLKSQDIDGYALAVGPGSFTGIRIGMGTVKAMASAHDKPVAPVSNLEALALKVRLPSARLLCPCQDAKKSEVYAALYEVKSQDMHEIVPQGVYTPDRFCSLLPTQRVISFIGTGVELYRTKILDYIKDKARFSRRSFFLAHEVGLIGYDLFRHNLGKDSREIEPLYLRRSQAEEKN
jgi:tRNA threonylcarbamoyladenosine biosynthesis protein TsaB